MARVIPNKMTAEVEGDFVVFFSGRLNTWNRTPEARTKSTGPPGWHSTNG